MTKRKLVAIQMDDIASVNAASDSTLVLGLEAQARGFDLFYYTPNNLTFDEGEVITRGHPIRLKEDFSDCAHGSYYEKGEATSLNLADASVVLLRQDPPFDMAYITNTFLLEHVSQQTLVVNDPAAVRNAPEKWYANAFPEFVPATMVSSNHDAINDFYTKHRDIVVKPLHGFGGHGVFLLKENDPNYEAVLEHLLETEKGVPIVAQAFVPEIKDGDLRVLLADGKVAGVIRRVPAKGEIRSNMRVGGTPAHATLTKRQQMICDALEPELKSRGIIFAGIDLIGDYLTEINVTSPTGLRAAHAVSDDKPEQVIWDAIEAKL